MKKIIHPVAGIIALLAIAAFWLSTAVSELFGSVATVVAVKSAIPWGFLLLIPALAAAGGSGIALAKGRRSKPIGTKLKRMPFIAANGILVLIPAALFLAVKAKAGEFDTPFYVVQAIELLAGPVNFVLLGLNMRDGLRMVGRLSRNKPIPTSGWSAMDSSDKPWQGAAGSIDEAMLRRHRAGRDREIETMT